MIEDCRDWTAIVAVANALLREKTLDGFEVEALVRDSKESFERDASPRPSASLRTAARNPVGENGPDQPSRWYEAADRVAVRKSP